ncbi:MAG: uncharacterized SAM-binding protein YcdF (DUF218 family) [Parasphingorhabdus sp.]|jgi:uncharacterized SAM-binding protein YcdF (DUF218 family)
MIFSAALLLLLATLIFFARKIILSRIGNFLLINNTRAPDFDAMVVMNGNISTRVFYAAELYKKHPVPILIARLADTREVRMGIIPNISEASCKLLLKLGVTDDDIKLVDSERWISGTWGEAILLGGFIRAQNYTSICIVTDAFHSRRALWTFKKVIARDDIDIFCVATPYSRKLIKHWWRSQYGLVQVVVEYLKFVHYQRLARSLKKNPSVDETDLPMAREVWRLVSGDSKPNEE